METIPEFIKKNEQKLIKFTKLKEKKKKKLKSGIQASESEKHFVNQILQRDAENIFQKLTLNISKSDLLNTPNRGRKNLKSLRCGSTVSLSSFSEGKTLNKSENQELNSSKGKSKVKSEKAQPSYESRIGLLPARSISKISEGVLSYFVGPGNNDLLIRKIMKKRQGWIRVSVPESANFIWTQVRKTGIFEIIPRVSRQKEGKKHPDLTSYSMSRLYNRLEGNFELTTKKKLFFNMFSYYKSKNIDPFTVIPITYHFTNGKNDPSYLKFCSKYQEIQAQMSSDPSLNNLWVIKPGEGTNRGIGVSVSEELTEITQKISEKIIQKNQQRTFIVQKYLYRPLLYKNRKFDIRCYALISCINGSIQAYFYKDGYLRTSCSVFSVSDASDKYVHLTNDAVQKNSSSYGMFEDANKLSYQDFQDYLNESLPAKVNFKEQILPKIRSIVKDTVSATFNKLNPLDRLHTFEILGYDFMIDEFFSPWLIEVNTNPCLELSGGYLRKLIPTMVKDGLDLAIGQVFGTWQGCERFELIFSL